MLDRLTGMKRGTLNEGKTAIEGTPARQEDWTLTQTGNWAGYDVAENGQAVLNQPRTNNKANEITGLSEPESQTQWVTPVHDARGNMTSVPKPSDLTATYTATYDAWNRLAEVKSGANVVLKCEYDGLGRRTKKHLNTGEDQVYDEFRHFFYNAAWQILETRDADDVDDEPEDLYPEYQYVWSLRYIDAPVLRDENKDDDDDCTESGTDERLYYLTDANMNVTALVGTDGTVLERYLYDPYGKLTVLDADFSVDADNKSDYDNSILFAGYYYDWETGLCNPRNRYYHPYFGCMISRDGGYWDGMSLYEYVASQPVARIDPRGLLTLIPPVGFPKFGGADPKEIRKSIVKAIDQIAPAGYHYVDVFRLRVVVEKLQWAVSRVEVSGTGLLHGLFGAAGAHDVVTNTLHVGPGADIIHEGVHAYDDLKDIYMKWSLGGEKAEALAAAASGVLGRTSLFANFEDTLKGPNAHDIPCGAWRENYWGGCWEHLKGVYTQTIEWGMFFRDNRYVEPADVTDAEEKLGFDISCKNIVEVYNAEFERLGIPDESKPGSCCTLACPEDLGPYE